MNALVPVESNVAAYRASTDAASMCRDIVVATAVTIQGRKYIPVEGWQAISTAHGCAAGSRNVERVDGGVRAIGEVRRMSDGALIAQAEGFVGDDEPVWFGGEGRDRNGQPKTFPKRADYAIRAMAQTRSISRACRSAFAHVVVMMKANLDTIPFEEAPYEGFDNTTTAKVPGIHKIKERLREMQARGNNECGDLDTLNKIVGEYEAELKTIEDANHNWWTGNNGEWESIPQWIERRRSELDTDSALNLAIDRMKDCGDRGQLETWMEANAAYLETLDGADSRRFQAAYDEFEAGLTAVDNVRAG